MNFSVEHQTINGGIATAAFESPAFGPTSELNEWQLAEMPFRPQSALIRLYDEAAGRQKFIGTTCFFRNRPLLRTLLERVDAQAPEINVLIHAASIGADVYSFIIAWQLFFRGRPAPRLRCFATDISGQFLAQASAGMYPAEILEGMAEAERAYFEPVDATTCRVKSEVRAFVEFLQPASYVTFTSDRQFDVVLLLNSLLYVTGADQATTFDRIATYHRGLLVVTGYHAAQVREDLERNGYSPITDRFEEIYESWTCRRSLAPGLMIDGVTFHTPAMEALHPCDDYSFRFGSLFFKEARPQAARRVEISRSAAPEPTRDLPSVALFNDTGSAPHVGCRGVSLAHDAMLAKLGREIGYRSFLGDWSDLWKGEREASLRAFHESDLPRILQEQGVVVVNGEGTIHHGFGLHLLTILAGAQEMGLPTVLVNAVFQECEQFLDVLRNLDDFTVRDARSSAYLKRLGVPHRVVLDSIIEAEFDVQPINDFRGKIVITDGHVARQGDVGNALMRLLAEFGSEAVYYPLEGPARVADWRHAVADLAQARLVVTGRHHGVCLAGLAGVPFVAFGSNTWKVEGLLELLPGNLQVCTEVRELRAVCERAMANPALYREIQKFLLAQRPLTTFQKLAGPELQRRAPKVFHGPAVPVAPEEKQFVTQLADFFGSRKLLQIDWLTEQSVRIAPYYLDSVEVAPSIVNSAAGRPSLPCKDNAFETTINLASLATLSDAGVAAWLTELRRVTQRDVWLALEAAGNRPLAWWQEQVTNAGFQPHPKLAELQPEPAAADGLGPITLVLEKTSAAPTRTPAVKIPTGTRPICLASNYLLMAESTRQMWTDFGRHLEEQGWQLVLLSTLLPEQPFAFPVYQIPYYMRNYAEWFPQGSLTTDVQVSPREMELLRADISRLPQAYPMSEAVAGLSAYRAFTRELLEKLQPGFVLLADNMLAQTAVLQRLCWDQNIPVQIYERGLLPETLMIESRGIQTQSDFRTNWLANEMPASAKDAAAYERLREYYLSRKPQKYVQPDFAGGGQTLREQLGLQGKKVVVFLGGGFEANGHAPKGGNQERAYFPAFPSTYKALMALWRFIEQQSDVALVFKPHPLDPETYAIAKVEGVTVVTDVNVHALIEAADIVAAQFTTLQFEVVFYDKPLLLLGRSVWWGRNATYEVDRAENLPGALSAALKKQDWPTIQANARAFNVWMMEQWLVGCHAAVPARQNLSHLAQFVARAGLASAGLPAATERWEATFAALERLRQPIAAAAPF